MMTQPIRNTSARNLLAAVLLVGLVGSCRPPQADPKGDLVASLKGADVGGYLFALQEGEAQTTTSLTNRIVNQPVTLGKADTDVVLGYTRTEDRKTRTAKTFKSEVIKKASSLALLVTELETNQVVDQRPLPVAGSICDSLQKFDSLAACISQFDCASRPAFQCKANQTCRTQFADVTCCLTNGSIFSVDLFINPNTLRCSIRGPIPDVNGFALSLN
jgi:hypothetical protein